MFEREFLPRRGKKEWWVGRGAAWIRHGKKRVQGRQGRHLCAWSQCMPVGLRSAFHCEIWQRGLDFGHQQGAASSGVPSPCRHQERLSQHGGYASGLGAGDGKPSARTRISISPATGQWPYLRNPAKPAALDYATGASRTFRAGQLAGAALWELEQQADLNYSGSNYFFPYFYYYYHLYLALLVLCSPPPTHTQAPRGHVGAHVGLPAGGQQHRGDHAVGRGPGQGMRKGIAYDGVGWEGKSVKDQGPCCSR